MNEVDLKTYDVDKIIDQANAHISAHADLTIVTHAKEGKTFLVIHVAQFRDTPLVCKKDGGLQSQSQSLGGVFSKKTSAGVRKPRHARGRSLSSFSTCRTS